MYVTFGSSAMRGAILRCHLPTCSILTSDATRTPKCNVEPPEPHSSIFVAGPMYFSMHATSSGCIHGAPVRQMSLLIAGRRTHRCGVVGDEVLNHVEYLMLGADDLSPRGCAG